MQTTACLEPFYFHFELGFIVKFESTTKPEREAQNGHLEHTILILSRCLQWFANGRDAPDSDGLTGARCLTMMILTKQFVSLPAKPQQRPRKGPAKAQQKPGKGPAKARQSPRAHS